MANPYLDALSGVLPVQDFSDYYKDRRSRGVGSTLLGGALSGLGILGQSNRGITRQRDNRYLNSMVDRTPQYLRDYSNNQIDKTAFANARGITDMGYGFGRTAQALNSVYAKAMEAKSDLNMAANAQDIGMMNQKLQMQDAAANEQIGFDYAAAKETQDATNKQIASVASLGVGLNDRLTGIGQTYDDQMMQQKAYNDNLRYQNALSQAQMQMQNDLYNSQFDAIKVPAARTFNPNFNSQLIFPIRPNNGIGINRSRYLNKFKPLDLKPIVLPKI
jgi:hypothetical protein